MKYSTTKIRPFETTAPEPEVVVRAFNSRGIAWKAEAPEWLKEKKAEGFECIEGHTLRITGGYHSAEFVIFVVEKARGPIRPLPTIHFNHFESGAASGHHIHIDLNESPQLTKIHRHFWERDEGQGETPNFERLVMPLVIKLASRLKGGSWAK